MNRSLTDTQAARNVRADALVAQMHRADRAVLAHAIRQQDMAELDRRAIAGRIRQARKEIGLSQPEMADALGVTDRTYQNYEAETKPRTPWGLMNQIAAVTGKTTEWLIHGDQTKLPEQLDGISDQVDQVVSRVSRRVNEVDARLAGIEQNIQAIAERIEELVTRISTPEELAEEIEAIAQEHAAARERSAKPKRAKDS